MTDNLDLSFCENLKSLTLQIHTSLPSPWLALDSATEALRSLERRTVTVQNPLKLLILRSDIGGTRPESAKASSLASWKSSLKELQNVVAALHVKSHLKVMFYVTPEFVQEIRTGLEKLDSGGVLTVVPSRYNSEPRI